MDLVNREMYFDDGLKSTAPPIALSSVKRSLELLLEIYPCHAALQAKFWHNCHRFQRFGMPCQTPVDSRMIGVGSCGIGVIMAAKDIILDGPLSINNFQWQYCEMDVHRKDLMLQILKWRDQAGSRGHERFSAHPILHLKASSVSLELSVHPWPAVILWQNCYKKFEN